MDTLLELLAGELISEEIGPLALSAAGRLAGPAGRSAAWGIGFVLGLTALQAGVRAFGRPGRPTTVSGAGLRVPIATSGSRWVPR